MKKKENCKNFVELYKYKLKHVEDLQKVLPESDSLEVFMEELNFLQNFIPEGYNAKKRDRSQLFKSVRFEII